MSINPLNLVTKPYYVYRPRQIWRRLMYELRKPAPPYWIYLPWGLRIQANPANDLGYALQTAGINDLMVTECLFRLAGLGELAVDVGANVGYTTSILSVCTGHAGRVFSFEPHPALYRELFSNLEMWKKQCSNLAQVSLINHAVSDRVGEAVLLEPSSFEANRGRSTLRVHLGTDVDSRELKVTTVSLDSQFKDEEVIGVLKVDVEGHEQQVFTGAQGLLSASRIRDVLFEEFRPYPAETHQTLERCGFRIFVVQERIEGPLLVSPSPQWKHPVHSPPNYIATRDTDRLYNRFQTRGWRCLRGTKARLCRSSHA